MNSKQSLMLLPFIQEFTFAVIKTIRSHNLYKEDKHIIHADLVPKISKKVMQSSLGSKRINRVENPYVFTPRIIKNETAKLITPIKNMQVSKPIIQMSSRQVSPQPQAPKIIPPIRTHVPLNISQGIPIRLNQNYGKITPLLDDPSVSTIECQGTEKPIMIIRAGQKQMTKITLNAEEIKNILKKVSDTTHIPLLDGVFRAAVDNFSINAIISGTIGSRFVIKKANAYSMLER